MNYKLKKISGDASFREFYRLQKGRHTSIIVQAKKEKFKNLITYIVVNDILKKNKFNDYKDLIKIIIKLQNIKLQRNYRLGKFK